MTDQQQHPSSSAAPEPQPQQPQRCPVAHDNLASDATCPVTGAKSSAPLTCPLGFGASHAAANEEDAASALDELTCPLCGGFSYQAITFIPCGHSACELCVKKVYEGLNGSSTATAAKCPVAHLHTNDETLPEGHPPVTTHSKANNELDSMKASEAAGSAQISANTQKQSSIFPDNLLSRVRCVRCAQPVKQVKSDLFKQYKIDSYMDTEWATIFERERAAGAAKSDDERLSNIFQHLSLDATQSIEKLLEKLNRCDASCSAEELQRAAERQLSRATYFFRESLRVSMPSSQYMLKNFSAALARCERAEAELQPLWNALPSDQTSVKRQMCNLLGVVKGRKAEMLCAVNAASSDVSRAKIAFEESCAVLRSFVGSNSVEIEQSLSTTLLKFGDFALYRLNDAKLAEQLYSENLELKQRQQSQPSVLDKMNMIGSALKLIEALRRIDSSEAKERIKSLASEQQRVLLELESGIEIKRIPQQIVQQYKTLLQAALSQ